MKKIEEKMNIATLFLCTGIGAFIFLLFYMPMYTRYWSLLLLTVDIVYILINKNLKIKINTTFVLWGIFIIVAMLGVYLSDNNSFDAIQLIYTLSLFLLNFILLMSTKNWIKYIIDMLFWIIIFFIFGMILQLISPELVMSINRTHLSNVQYLDAIKFIRNGSVVGFTYQTAVSGYLLSVFMAVTFINLFKSTKIKTKVLMGIVCLIAFYLMFMTGKRGFIVFNAVIIIFLITKLTKYKFTSFIPICLFVVFFIIILFNTEVGQGLMFRTMKQGDITTGRSGMYSIMWDDFLEHPLIGNGTYTTIDVVFAYNGHNIYLQVLREHGLLGFIPFIIALFFNFFKTNKMLNHVNKNSIFKYFLSFSMYMQLLFIFWGVTGNPLYDVYPVIIYFIGIAMMYTIETTMKKDLQINEKIMRVM